MSNIYDALQIAQGKRLSEPNELNDESTPSPPRPLIGVNPPSTPRFHEKSELLALAQTIAACLPNPNQRVIQFIGSQAGEGTSTLIREFALTVAPHNSKPVLLIEADSNQPSQAQAFAVEAKPPLDYVLREGKPFDGFISQINQSNLFLASLSSNFFRSLTDRSFFHSTDMWKTARNQFSLILIDSSPVNASADGLAICEFVNGVVLVIAAEKTRSAVAQNVKREILRREGNLLGIVFTKRKFHIPKSIHKHL
jgi:Mrp family chromosome partitioning ATPase